MGDTLLDVRMWECQSIETSGKELIRKVAFIIDFPQFFVLCHIIMYHRYIFLCG